MIGSAGIGIVPGQTSGPKDDITGTVSKAEPPTTQDGTPTHPYADANQARLAPILFFGRAIARSRPSWPIKSFNAPEAENQFNL